MSHPCHACYLNEKEAEVEDEVVETKDDETDKNKPGIYRRHMLL